MGTIQKHLLTIKKKQVKFQGIHNEDRRLGEFNTHMSHQKQENQTKADKFEQMDGRTNIKKRNKGCKRPTIEQ